MYRRPLFFTLIILLCAAAIASATTDKLSISLRTALRENSSWHQRKHKVECFVRIRGAYSDEAAKALRDAGLLVRSVLPANERGTILTGYIPLSKLLDVAVLEYVQSIEGSVPVGRKRPVGLK